MYAIYVNGKRYPLGEDYEDFMNDDNGSLKESKPEPASIEIERLELPRKELK